MTENYGSVSQYASPYAGDVSGATGMASTDLPTDDGSSKKDAAKEQAGQVGQAAADAGSQVASTAKDQAANVAQEAKSQAQDLLHQSRSELSDQAGTQQKKVASGLHALADELGSMSDHSGTHGVATEFAGQVADRSRDVAGWLESHEPTEVLDEVKRFAQRRPGAFLLAAVGAGLLAGRVGRGVKDAPDSSGSGTTTTSTPVVGSAPSQPVAEPSVDSLAAHRAAEKPTI